MLSLRIRYLRTWFIVGPLLLTALSYAQQPTRQGLHRLSIGVSDGGHANVTGQGGTWYLSRLNQTSVIDSAYRYDNEVIVFGWIGCCSGITTIIDASTGAEVLEFLAYDPHITPAGSIIFRHFYPHFSDPMIVSDLIGRLDLNRDIPHNVPAHVNENPTAEVGEVIYPLAPAAGVRHEIGHDFVITEKGQVLFLIDRESSGKFCFVRKSLAGTADERRRCVDSAVFGAESPSAVHISEFAENAFGDLVLSVDVGPPNFSAQKNYEFNEESLQITELQKPPKLPQETIAIPWFVQKTAFLNFVPIDTNSRPILEHAQETVTTRMTIDRAGVVRDVAISGASESIAARLKGALFQWRFKPTVLDGRQVGVTTEFSTQLKNFSDVP